MFKLLFLPIKIIIGFLKLSGVKGTLLLGLGVAIGLLVAPQRGAQLRAELQSRLAGARPGMDYEADSDLTL